MPEEHDLCHSRHENDLQLCSSSAGYFSYRSDGMELEQVSSELVALGKLYGLLQTSEDGEVDASASLHLDERAQLLLKELLDQASEKLLKKYSQIITDQLSSRAACSASSSLQPADSTPVAINSPPFVPSIKSESGSDGTFINMMDDATPTSKEAPRLLGLSSRKPGMSNKLSGASVRRSMMQQVPPGEIKRRPVTASQSMWDDSLRKSSVLVQGSRPLPRTLEKSNNQKPPRNTTIQPINPTSVKAESSNRRMCPHRDISYAIKRIEAQILVLQHLSRVSNPLESAPRQTKELGTKNPSDTGSQTARKLVNSPSHLMENYNISTTTAAGGRTETPSSQSSKFMHGFHLPNSSVPEFEMSPNKKVYHKPVGKLVHPRPLVPSRGAIQSVTSASSTNRMLKRGKKMTSQESICTTGKNRLLVKRNLPRQTESKESSSDSWDSSSYGSSPSSSEQTSTSSSYTSEDSLQSYSDDYTDGSRESTSESEDSRSSSSYSEPVKKVVPAKRSRSPKPGGAIGRLRKIKNKLGLIFHHHHHHHHHHHREDKRDGLQDKSKWKKVGNGILRGRDKHQTNGDREVTVKSRKTVDKRSQGGHFHALAEGLLSHIRHKKKKKIRPPDHNGLRKTKRSRKLHWWQMMRRRGGVKLPKGRGRKSKLKFSNKRMWIRAP